MNRSTTLIGVLALAAVLAACGDAGSPDRILEPGDASFKASANASQIAQIQTRITALFAQPAKRDALKQFATIKNAVATGDLENARSLAELLVQFALDAELLDPKGPETTDQALARMTEELYAFTGQADVAAVVVQPDSEETVVTPEEQAGATFPAGSADTPFVAVISRVELGPGEQCLPTDRPQREGCYHYSTVPELPSFDQLVTVGICFDDAGLTDDQRDRYRLYKYHEGDANVVALENTTTPFTLNCDEELAAADRGVFGRLAHAAARLVAPRPAYAAHTGLGGLVGSFSRIGWAGSTVLIYEPSLGSNNPAFTHADEATLANDAGHYAVVMDSITWSGMSATGQGGFADYDAIVLGEGNGDYGPAIATTATWGGVVNGNVVVSAQHTTQHYCDAADAGCPSAQSFPAAGVLYKNSLDWVARGHNDGQPWTGLLVLLGGRYIGDSPTTPTSLPFLSGVGSFAVYGQGLIGSYGDPFDDVTITDSSHPIFDGPFGTLTSADLSGWYLSLHQFLASWPGDFTTVLTGNQLLVSGDPFVVRSGIIVRDAGSP